MTWYQVDCAIDRWIDRGGTYNPLSSGKLIPVRFSGIQDRVNEYQEKKTKKIIVKAPKFTEIIEPSNPHLKRWNAGQRIVIQDDLRSLLCAIPGTKIGPERADAIWSYMAENGVRQTFLGFLAMVRDESLLNIPGVGKGTLRAIRDGLFKTLEERENKNESN
jgi:hypothetical protein